MTTQQLIGVLSLALALGCGAFGLYFYFGRSRSSTNMRQMMGGVDVEGMSGPSDRRRRVLDGDARELQRLAEETREKYAKKKDLSLEELMFRAGIFTPDQRRDFERMRVFLPIVFTPLGAALGFFGTDLLIAGLAVFGLGSLQLPKTILERRIKSRDEDMMYYLPLVIEQIAIGVSSSLDIGPCLQRVVQMADERDTHNPVTELLKIVQQQIRSGVSMDDGLNEIGRRSGHTELKHAFMSLAQVARHGGEITKQLQELAEAVSNQRETRIEAKIKRLELEATGPVALTFMGYLIILLSGFGVQVMGALK